MVNYDCCVRTNYEDGVGTVLLTEGLHFIIDGEGE